MPVCPPCKLSGIEPGLPNNRLNLYTALLLKTEEKDEGTYLHTVILDFIRIDAF